MLTEEEKEDLQQERFEARYRCREIWATVCHIRKILKSYEDSHYRWSMRHEKADRALAEEDKLTKVPSPGQGPKQVAITLTKEQILQIADELGVDVSIEEEGGDESYEEGSDADVD